MMQNRPLGIHHVTAISGDAQRNLDFYTGLLGLRLVKKTVNFDDPGTYHLYYGDEEGNPGTIMTFFPWQGAPRGSLGTGQIGTTSFSVPPGSLAFWQKRLEAAGLPVESPRSRFDEEVLTFPDPDGLRLELVAHEEALELDPWHDGPIAPEHALRAFFGVTLIERSVEPTAVVLTDSFGYEAGEASGQRHRFVAAGGGPASRLDVIVRPDEGFGRVAVGSVHHVAFRIPDDESQDSWRQAALAQGLQVTPVRDRNYFHSVYFREPGGVLFEVATDPPGFAIDESVSDLGRSLRLPAWLEPQRHTLETLLPPLKSTTPAALTS
jgi:glyoxalase family protein